jgi:hypothetical protein
VKVIDEEHPHQLIMIGCVKSMHTERNQKVHQTMETPRYGLETPPRHVAMVTDYMLPW